MKLLAVVTPPSIYHCWSTWKTFWEENFTGKKDLFQSVNMKTFGRHKVRKHKEIKGSDKIVTLNISAKFDSLNKIKTTSSDWKGKLGRSGKGLVTALAFKTKVGSQKYKKGKVCHLKYQQEGPFEDYQRFWENWQSTLCENYPQTWANFRILSSIKWNLWIVWWGLMNTTGTFTAVMRKRLLRHWELMLRTRTNKKIIVHD